MWRPGPAPRTTPCRRSRADGAAACAAAPDSRAVGAPRRGRPVEIRNRIGSRRGAVLGDHRGDGSPFRDHTRERRSVGELGDRAGPRTCPEGAAAGAARLRGTGRRGDEPRRPRGGSPCDRRPGGRGRRPSEPSLSISAVPPLPRPWRRDLCRRPLRTGRLRAGVGIDTAGATGAAGSRVGSRRASRSLPEGEQSAVSSRSLRPPGTRQGAVGRSGPPGEGRPGPGFRRRCGSGGPPVGRTPPRSRATRRPSPRRPTRRAGRARDRGRRSP